MDIDLSLKSIEYERNVGKITDIFAEAGGLYTAVFGVFSIVVLIYYNHKLRLKLAEYTFKSSNNSIKPSDYGFIKSLRYGTRGIVKPNENSEFAQECKRIEQNLNEVNSLVHIETILNRLQILESTLESEDKDKFLCSTMFQKSTLRKIQLKRLRIEYYSYIVQGRNSITIRDARKLYNGLGMSLEDFLNKRLKHRMQLLGEIKSEKGNEKLGQSVESNNRIVNPEIEGSQRISTQTLIIFQENKSGLNTLHKVINQFRNIKAEAEQLKMIPEYDKIEVSLAKAFYKVDEKQRAKRQQKIPIIILHRLMKAIYQLRMKKQERKRKAKQDGDGKAQHLEKNVNKEEEEEFSDSIDCFDEED